MPKRCEERAGVLDPSVWFILDAFNIGVERFVPGQYGYKDDDIVMLTDDAPNPQQMPTRENIVSLT